MRAHARSCVATATGINLPWTAVHPPASLREPPCRPSRIVFSPSSFCVRAMLLHAHCRMRPCMPCVVPLPLTSQSGARHLRLCAGLLFPISSEACHIFSSAVCFASRRARGWPSTPSADGRVTRNEYLLAHFIDHTPPAVHYCVQFGTRNWKLDEFSMNGRLHQKVAVIMPCTHNTARTPRNSRESPHVLSRRTSVPTEVYDV